MCVFLFGVPVAGLSVHLSHYRAGDTRIMSCCRRCNMGHSNTAAARGSMHAPSATCFIHSLNSSFSLPSSLSFFSSVPCPATLLRMVTLAPIIPFICSFVKLQSLKLSMQPTKWHGSVALNQLPWRRLLIAITRLFMHCHPQSLPSFLHSFFPSFPPFILRTFPSFLLSFTPFPSFPTFLPTSYLPTFYPACLSFLPSFISSFILSFLLSFLSSFLPFILHTFPAFLLSFTPFPSFPTFLPTFLPIILHTFPSFLPSFLHSFFPCILPSFLPSFYVSFSTDALYPSTCPFPMFLLHVTSPL